MSIAKAVEEQRSVFVNSIKNPLDAEFVLKPGSNNSKLGFTITKGKWKGKKIFSLTLEERKTCPTYCHHFKSCYGNNMFLAHRFSTNGLTEAIERDLEKLTQQYPKGIVVRLHVLGDFYSVEYVNFWKSMMEKYPTLNVFGYTARDFLKDPIGKAVRSLNNSFAGRSAIRQSANRKVKGKLMFAANEDYKGSAFNCPEQTGKVSSCSNCSACWSTTKTVRFTTH